MKKESYESSVKKYTRRKALSKGWYLTKIAGGGILGGVVGNVVGRIYQTERDAVRNIINYSEDKREKVEKFYDKQKSSAKNVYEFLREKVQGENYQPPKKTRRLPEKNPQQRTTRRGFLSKLALGIHEHPIPSLTIIGTTYGAGKMTLRGYENYRRKMWELEDKLEKAEDRNEIIKLRKEIEELKQLIEQNYSQQSKLEKKADQNDEPHFNQTLLTSGGVGLVVSMILISIRMTGYSISKTISNNPIIPAIIFIVSLILILIGLKRK